MKKDKEQFEGTVRQYSEELYRYAYWLCQDPDDAKDLVQQCFLRAWSGWHNLRDISLTKSWLITILRREFLKRLPAKEVLEDDGYDSLPFEQPDIDEVLALRQALSKVPLSLREPLLLQVIGGFNCHEIAEIQNTSSGAIMARLTRARQWLRSFLTKEERQRRGATQ